jgi:hypothetical protein
VLGRGCFCIWGASFVCWVIVGCLDCLVGVVFVFGELLMFIGCMLGAYLWVFGASLCFGVFLCFCGLAELFLCILPVYLGRFTLF